MQNSAAKLSSVTPYDRGFFNSQASGSRRSAEGVLPLVFDLVRPSSILDVGCGVGTWLAVAQDSGIDEYLGVDGDYVTADQLQIPASRFVACNLLRRLDLGRRFDLVMSLEVAEHIDPSAATIFIENLVRHGQVILFSAAIPGQRGVHHVNLQWPAYWAEKFMKHDYVALDLLRARIWENQNIEYWYRQNVLLYVHKDRLNLFPQLSADSPRKAQPPIGLVHPELYTQRPNLGAIVRDLPRAIRESITSRTRRMSALQTGKKLNRES